MPRGRPRRTGSRSTSSCPAPRGRAPGPSAPRSRGGRADRSCRTTARGRSDGPPGRDGRGPAPPSAGAWRHGCGAGGRPRGVPPPAGPARGRSRAGWRRPARLSPRSTPSARHGRPPGAWPPGRRWPPRRRWGHSRRRPPAWGRAVETGPEAPRPRQARRSSPRRRPSRPTVRPRPAARIGAPEPPAAPRRARPRGRGRRAGESSGSARTWGGRPRVRTARPRVRHAGQTEEAPPGGEPAGPQDNPGEVVRGDRCRPGPEDRDGGCQGSVTPSDATRTSAAGGSCPSPSCDGGRRARRCRPC